MSCGTRNVNSDFRSSQPAETTNQACDAWTKQVAQTQTDNCYTAAAGIMLSTTSLHTFSQYGAMVSGAGEPGLRTARGQNAQATLCLLTLLHKPRQTKAATAETSCQGPLQTRHFSWTRTDHRARRSTARPRLSTSWSALPTLFGAQPHRLVKVH